MLIRPFSCSNLGYTIGTALVTIGAYMCMIDSASAAVIGPVLCKAASMLGGKSNTLKGLATIAIIVIGLGALFGKISWGKAVLCGVGIAVMVGAAALVTSLSGLSNCLT